MQTNEMDRVKAAIIVLFGELAVVQGAHPRLRESDDFEEAVDVLGFSNRNMNLEDLFYLIRIAIEGRL